MSRYLVLLFALNIQGFASIANASNDLDKWNSEQGRVVRSALKEKLSTTTYTEKYPLHTDSTYKASENGGKVLTKLETSAEIKGSRVGATIDALEKLDKYAPQKKWAQQFAKKWGPDLIKKGAAGVLITAALDEMLDGIGWIIDEGGKVTKSPEQSSTTENVQGKYTSDYQYYIVSNDNKEIKAYTVANACIAFFSYHNSWQNVFIYSFEGLDSPTVCKDKAVYVKDGKLFSNGTTTPKRRTNPYKTATPPASVPVPQQEIEQKINDYFNDPKSPSSKDLLIEQALKPKGKASIMWSDDPSSEQTIFSDHKNTAEKILNSDNPQGDGLTKTTPVITDGTATETETNTDTTTNTDVNETTTTNPDGSTTTTGSNTSAGSSSTTSTSKLPAFCDYASKLCDWLDWTKEMPEDEEKPEEENINDLGIFNRELDTQFNLEGSCPSDFNFQMTNKYFAGSYTIPLNWLCISFTFIGYALIFLSNCIGMWILYETVTRKELRF